MVMERIDRQGVNVSNKLSMAFLRPQYGDNKKTDIVVAGDIESLGSAGNVRPVFTDVPRLNSMTYLFDYWEISENITFQLHSYVPEIDRMAADFNVHSNVSRDEETHLRTTRNYDDTDEPITPRIMIFVPMQSVDPSGAGDGHATNGLVILAEGIWLPSEISFQRNNLVMYDIEFLPNRLYIRTIAGTDPDQIESQPRNADRYHDFVNDQHWIDGKNHTFHRERRMGLLSVGDVPSTPGL